MKKFFFLISIFVFSTITNAQSVGIGTNTPNASAALEIKADTKGMLIPRTSTITRMSILNPAKGLMIYDTTSNSFWFHNGTAWVQFGGSGWSLTGNAGTNPATNFLGTSDAQAFVFKVNNTRAGFIDYNTANTSFGYNALTGITTGNYNTATGTGSLLANTTGFSNTAYGSYALVTNIGGSFNVAAGSDALHNNTSGSFNSAVGTQALYTNTSGDQNTATGYEALQLNNTGSGNVANGFEAMLSNITGYANNATGFQSLYNNKDGHDNTGVGYSALFSNVSGNGNTSLGNFSLYSNTGSSNTANGFQALFHNVTGNNNTATGYASLFNNTTGYSNIANGTFALLNNTTSYSNIAVGDHALFSNTIQAHNIAIGDSASFNTNYSGAVICSNCENTAIGSKALFTNTSGGGNTACGSRSLYNNNIGGGITAIGAYSDVSTGDLFNATALGSGVLVNASNKVRIGDGFVTMVESNAGSWTTSDGRFKNNIIEDVKGLAFIKLLRPVIYNFDTRKFNEFLMQNYPDSVKSARMIAIDKQSMTKSLSLRQSGFIAQEVADAAKKSGYDFNGVHAPENPTDNWSLSYEKLVVPLVKAMQEQQQMIEDLKKENAEIKGQLKKLTEIISKK